MGCIPIPIIVARVIAFVGLGLMVVGAVLIIYSLRGALGKIKEQQNVITELETRQWRRTMREPFIAEITDTLQKMHTQLQTAVDKRAKLPVSKKVVEEIMTDFVLKMGISPRFISRVKEPPFSRIQMMYIIFKANRRLKLKKQPISQNKEFLYHMLNLGGEMDRKGLGLLHEQETDPVYKELAKRLDNLRTRVADNKLNDAIDNYLTHSYCLNSFLLLSIYRGLFEDKYNRWLPSNYKLTETQMRKAFDIQMHRLLTNVAKHVEDALLGGEPK